MKQTDELFNAENRLEESSAPVECLGQTFRNDQMRREHFLKLLAEKLRDPEVARQNGTGG